MKLYTYNKHDNRFYSSHHRLDGRLMMNPPYMQINFDVSINLTVSIIFIIILLSVEMNRQI